METTKNATKIVPITKISLRFGIFEDWRLVQHPGGKVFAVDLENSPVTEDDLDDLGKLEEILADKDTIYADDLDCLLWGIYEANVDR